MVDVDLGRRRRFTIQVKGGGPWEYYGDEFDTRAHFLTEMVYGILNDSLAERMISAGTVCAVVLGVGAVWFGGGGKLLASLLKRQ